MPLITKLTFQFNRILQCCERVQVPFSEIKPRYVKQRSDIWFEVCKQACVTGSTLHSAIGLRGLKEKQNHFTKFIENVDSPISEEIQTRLSHGTKHEHDAIATLVGRFLPAYYPNAIFVEEGCYVLPADTADIFCVVSPDGSIRASTNNKVIAAVEKKMPFSIREANCCPFIVFRLLRMQVSC